MKSCTPLWREARSEVKMDKTPQLRTTFRSCDVEKMCAIVARITFPSQNVQNTSEHTMFGPLLEVAVSKKCAQLWRESHFEVKMYKAPQLRTTFRSCDVEKNEHSCGANHISKSKCTSKHTMFGPLLKVAMSKKCTPLWRKAHFQVTTF